MTEHRAPSPSELEFLRETQCDLAIDDLDHGLSERLKARRAKTLERIAEIARQMSQIAGGAIQVFALLAVLLMRGQAFAQGHRHPSADTPIHEKFYSTWFMPDQPTKSCCNLADCYPTEVRMSGGRIQAKRREDGKWLTIPEAKIERNRDNPDGRNHLCAPAPQPAYPPETVFCFTLGAGG